MKENKFRGQRADTKEWVYGDIVHNYDGRIFVGEIVFDGQGENLELSGYGVYEVIPDSVGQDTSISKNGLQ